MFNKWRQIRSEAFCLLFWQIALVLSQMHVHTYTYTHNTNAHNTIQHAEIPSTACAHAHTHTYMYTHNANTPTHNTIQHAEIPSTACAHAHTHTYMYTHNANTPTHNTIQHAEIPSTACAHAHIHVHAQCKHAHPQHNPTCRNTFQIKRQNFTLACLQKTLQPTWNWFQFHKHNIVELWMSFHWTAKNAIPSSTQFAECNPLKNGKVFQINLINHFLVDTVLSTPARTD